MKIYLGHICMLANWKDGVCPKCGIDLMPHGWASIKNGIMSITIKCVECDLRIESKWKEIEK